ncbi:MAG: sodium/proton-translocating pyrophosphatase, partial [Dethiosulfatibacter sp.]|nr:sodium/proton-translocating pyrophosphatase [Dethiosulfatibacter sp.]
MDFIIAPVLGVVALLYAYYKAVTINKVDMGTERMKEIATYIQEGSMAFLSREYKTLVVFTGILFVILGFGIGWTTALCFLIGALFSALAGFFGMRVATQANVRTTNAAMEFGMNKALSVAFSGGA